MFKFYFAAFLLVLINMVTAQPMRFSNIPVESTITRSYISDLLQDQNSFIWIASVQGLGRYDGHEMETFKFIKNNQQSLCSNSVQSLYAARDGKIWIGTKGGLSMYNPESEQITCLMLDDSYTSYNNEIILDVIEDKKGFIWYSTYNGLYRLDTKDYSRKKYLPQDTLSHSIANTIVFSIFEDKSGVLWFAGRKGISYYANDDSDEFVNIMPDPQNPNALQHERFFCFTQTENGKIWLGGDTGLYEIVKNADDVSFINYAHQENNSNSLSYDFVNHLQADKEDIWISTWAGGLNKFSQDQADIPFKFEHYRSQKDNPYSLSTDEITITLVDHSGVLWVGTGFGLMQSSSSTNKFGAAISSPNVISSLSTNKVQCTLVDSHGDLWVGTDNGLNYQAARHKGHPAKFQTFYHSNSNDNSLCHNNVFDLYEDSSNRLWVATYSGLSILDLNNPQQQPTFQTIKFDQRPHNWVYHILETGNDTFWVATYGKLARMYYPSDAKAPKLDIFDMDPENPNALSNATTYQSCMDAKGRVWIGTYYGLSVANASADTVTFRNFYPDRLNPNSISDVTINCLLFDKKERLWIGTKQGLNLVVEEENDQFKFITYDEQSGLPDPVINFIEEDEQGILWLGTGDGLVQFDSDKAIAGLNPILNVYTSHDGLNTNQAALRSSSKDQNGNIYFGTEGLNYFNPQELKTNKQIPPLMFTKFEIDGAKITPDQHPEILEKSISQNGAKVKLKWNQNIFKIYFAAIDYANPGKNQYKYKLEGFDNDWISTNKQNYASYTNLHAGSYIFKMMGSNNDAVWNSQPKSLQIIIAPHWSKSTMAYVLYIAACILLISLYQKWKQERAREKIQTVKNLELARYEERELLRKKNAADFHDELGHRLTKIGLFIEIANKHAGDNEQLLDYLTKIKTNTKSLSGGLKDLIWSLDPSKDTLLDTINRIQEFGDNLFEYSTIKFSTNPINLKFSEWKLSANKRKHILLIFKEAMNNTLKYSQADQCIFGAEELPQGVLLKLKDDGRGFDKATVVNGEGLKNIHERAVTIDSTITIKSTPHNGTAVQLLISTKDLSSDV